MMQIANFLCFDPRQGMRRSFFPATLRRIETVFTMSQRDSLLSHLIVPNVRLVLVENDDSIV